MSLLQFVVAAACVACAGALRLGAPPARLSAAVTRTQCAQLAPLPALRVPVLRMQVELDEAAKSFYEEYVETDPVTGEQKSLSLDEKEKLYLECLDAFYNEGGKQLLGDAEYEKLKTDLAFEGAKVSTFSADEIKFLLSNKRFKMGKPIMDDVEYDRLRTKLKAEGSLVIIHDAAKCSLDDGICKTDIRVDSGKTRLLYLPGTAGGLILACEAAFWTLHIDPLLSILLGAVPSYFFGIWFTENVFAQKPLVTTSACPNCGQLNTVFFGDLFSVQTDGMAGPPKPPTDQIEVKCSSCKEILLADRAEMVIRTTVPKGA